jgi:hypothetical protein
LSVCEHAPPHAVVGGRLSTVAPSGITTTSEPSAGVPPLLLATAVIDALPSASGVDPNTDTARSVPPGPGSGPNRRVLLLETGSVESSDQTVPSIRWPVVSAEVSVMPSILLPMSRSPSRSHVTTTPVVGAPVDVHPPLTQAAWESAWTSTKSGPGGRKKRAWTFVAVPPAVASGMKP